MTLKEFIKKMPFIGDVAYKIWHRHIDESGSFKHQQDDWTIRVEKIETIYGRFFAWEGDTIGDQLKKYSAHTRNELAMIKSFISPGDNIIDIGAHIGTFSIPFFLFNKGQGKIFAFEANPENYNLLRINIVENNANACIIPHLSIVSSKILAYKMFLPELGNSGMYSFLPKKRGNRSDNNCISIDKWHSQNHRDIKIDFIKIDVEGAEVSVLESCQNLIKEQKPILYIEVNKEALALFNNSVEDVERLVRLNGYHYYRNTGARNSNNDTYKITRLSRLKDGGDFFDFLAIHPSSQKYPQQTWL